jgi:hypothetical protein
MKKGKKNKKPIEDLPKTQSSSHVIVNVKPTTDNEITELPGYEKEVYNIPNIDNGNKSVCWNCCHPITTKEISQPIKYENGVFTTIGSFCSYPCICRYTIESNQTSELIFSKLSLLNLYANMQCETKGLNISPSPPRLSLKMFGGHLDIDEYRNRHIDYLTISKIDPIVKCLDLSINELHINKQSSKDNKKLFKLYRKNKKSSTNDIYASMNLISE